MVSEEQYYKEKCEYLEKQITELMNKFDKGGAIPVFPSLKEWRDKEYWRMLRETDKFL